MADRLPAFGETWTNTHVQTDGIVFGVVEKVVTFVSLTGVRVPISFDRRDSGWTFKSAIPTLTQTCTRRDCPHPGFLTYKRNPRATNLEVVCPLHIPRGTGSQKLSALVPGVTLDWETCWGCHQDAQEVIGEIHQAYLGPSYEPFTRMWLCSRCNVWCVKSLLDHRHRHSELTSSNLLSFLSGRFNVLRIDETPDPMSCRDRLLVTLSPKTSTQLRAKALTVYEQLLLEDEL